MIEQAIQLAHESTDFQHRIGCVVLDKKGRVISSGYNMRKTHPLQYKHARHYNEEAIFLHAEIAALVKCRREPHAILVGRILRSGDVALAKPCPICMSAIEEAGIKEIQYTTNDGTVETIALT